MNEFVKFILLVIGVMSIVAGVQSVAVNFSPTNAYFIGLFTGIIANAIISYVLMFEVDK